MATDDVGDGPPNLQLIGVASAVGSFAAIAYVSYLLFDAPAFGVLAGAMVGAGSYFHLPYFMRFEGDDASATDEVTGDAVTDDAGAAGGASQFHGGALGLGLDAGGIAAVALAFVVGASGTALAAGVLVALVGYLVLSRILPESPAE